MKFPAVQFCSSMSLLVLLLTMVPRNSDGAKLIEAEDNSRELLIKLESGITMQRGVAGLAELKIHEVRQLTGSMAGIGVYRVDRGANVDLVLKKLKKNSLVRYAQPNHEIHAFTDRIPANASSSFAGNKKPPIQPRPAEVLPLISDPDLGKVYSMARTQASAAWSYWRGNQNIIVAVIDTGIDYNHEDLAFNMWRNPNPSSEGDIVGYDFLHKDGFPYDDDEMNGHGTFAAGIIGAVGGNGKGISGVSPRVSLMALKAFSAYNRGEIEMVIAAIGYAVDHGAKIISNSWASGAKDNPAVIDAIQKARDKGVLLFFAAGNSKNDDDDEKTADYPAGYGNIIDNIVAVASTDSDDQLAPASGFGKNTVMLAAPGVNIYSTLPGNKYGWESGTSMACPFAAGVAALVWSKHPDWNYLQVKKALFDSVDVLPQLRGKVISGGRVNALKALAQEE